MRTILLFLLLTPSLIAQDARERFEKLIQPKPPIEQPKPSEDVPVPPDAPSVEPAPSLPQVTFSTVVKAAPQPERYLAVGDYCPACPAGKKNFLASGGKEENIVDWSVANRDHGQKIKVIPSEYWFQPAVSSSPETVVATADVEASPEAVVYVLAEYLSQQTAIANAHKVAASGAKQEETTYSGWFEYDINLPDSVPFIFQKLMKDRSYKNDKLGLLLQWPGEPTIKLGTTSIKFQPAIQASVRKLGITASASISEITFTPDYKSVTVITPEVMIPNLTINFK